MSFEQWQSILLSLQVALFSVAISLPPAIATARLLSRKKLRGKAILETVVSLPLVLPPVVTGYLLLISFGRSGFVGKRLVDWFGIAFVFDFNGAVLAAAIVSFPLMVRAIRIAFESIDTRLLQAAMTLGANPWRRFWSISIPLARRGIIAGCLLAFARSLGEFGATIMIAGNISGETKTIPLFIFDQLQTPGGLQHAVPVIVVSIVLALVALMISNRLEQSEPANA